MDWKDISTVVSVLAIQGALILAAAKSIFVVKKQLYNGHGLPHFITREELEDINQKKYLELQKISEKTEMILSIVVPRLEWETSKNERMLRYDSQQDNLLRRMEELVSSNIEMRAGQIEIGKSLTELQTLIKMINKEHAHIHRLE